MSKQRFTHRYMLVITGIGAVAALHSAYHLPVARLDGRLLLLAAFTLLVSSRMTIKIPRLSSQISVSDTFIFITMLLFGGEAAVLLAAAEAFCSSWRFCKKTISVVTNAAILACSTFATTWTLRLVFGDIIRLPNSEHAGTFIIAVYVMACVQYLTNSGLASVYTACKTDAGLWQTWSRSYLWTSLTYIAGASAAGLVAYIVDTVGFYTVVATSPIIAVLYFTYHMYLQNVEASARQAEQAERHVEQLNHYIAEQERIWRELQHRETRFRELYDEAPVGYHELDRDGRITSVNRTELMMLGYTADEMLGRYVWEFVEDHATARQAVAAKLTGVQPLHPVERNLVRKDSSLLPVLIEDRLVKSADGHIDGIRTTIQNITERKRAEAALHSLSLIDELSGLYNRRGFLTFAKEHAKLAERTGKDMMLIFIDMDGMKSINDTYGHAEGDQALKKTARFLRGMFRDSDVIARLGGDEFTVLATSGGGDSAESITRRMEENLASYNAAHTSAYELALSVGVVECTGAEATSIEELMVKADEVMYEQKRHKRGARRGAGGSVAQSAAMTDNHQQHKPNCQA